MKTMLLPLLAALSFSAPAGGPIVVKASPVVGPCVAAALPLFRQETGRAVSLDTVPIGRVGSAAGGDVVVAVEEELTRVIEGGDSAPDLDVDVATIPWVLVGGGGARADLRALARSETRVRVWGGSLSRHARASLDALPPERVQTVRAPSGLRDRKPGELALVPLSLAEAGPASATDVQPLSVRALGLRAGRADAARAFLQFLASGPGNAAFRACGRDGGR